jgi:hypothetical protein
VPAATFGVLATLALANFLASSSFGNVSVALACARLRRGRASYETYHVAWGLYVTGVPQAVCQSKTRTFFHEAAAALFGTVFVSENPALGLKRGFLRTKRG